MSKMTQQQKAEIYCVKHGHADYVWLFWGYVHCGRCGTHIGDRLAGVFDLKGCIVVGHRKNCKECNKVKLKNEFDKVILQRLRVEYKKKHLYDYDKILKGVGF